jgi:hypothetical protein
VNLALFARFETLHAKKSFSSIAHYLQSSKKYFAANSCVDRVRDVFGRIFSNRIEASGVLTLLSRGYRARHRVNMSEVRRRQRVIRCGHEAIA